MITPQLVKYIKDQLSSGSSKETIKSLLMTNGWSNQDLDEAFKIIVGQPDIPLPHNRLNTKRKNLLSAGFITVSLIYVFAQYTNGVFGSQPTPNNVNTTQKSPNRVFDIGLDNETNLEDSEEGGVIKPMPTNATTTTSATTPKPDTTTNNTPPTTKKSGIYKDGSYTGDVADAYYGIVQIKAYIQNGYLKDVVFLNYPNDRRTSQNISAYATPILRSEAIQAQSANVDIVSGATNTSIAFKQSLASALTQAKN